MSVIALIDPGEALDAPEWDARTLGASYVTHGGRYMALALECAARLAE